MKEIRLKPPNLQRLFISYLSYPRSPHVLLLWIGLQLHQLEVLFDTPFSLCFSCPATCIEACQWASRYLFAVLFPYKELRDSRTVEFYSEVSAPEQTDD